MWKTGGAKNAAEGHKMIVGMKPRPHQKGANNRASREKGNITDENARKMKHIGPANNKRRIIRFKN